jgi:hypothetical protein
VILSGLGVEPIKSLGFLGVFIGTAKPDIMRKTGHLRPAKHPQKPLIFGLFRLFPAYSGIPDNIGAEIHRNGGMVCLYDSARTFFQGQ